MNSITVAGLLGRDAETRFMPNGDPVASFSVADGQGKEKPTIWWNCQLFGKRAESLAPYLTKGQAVTVTGNVTMREYTGSDGVAKKATEIRVQDIALQGGRKDAAPVKTPDNQTAHVKKPASTGSGFDDMDDDIPF